MKKLLTSFLALSIAIILTGCARGTHMVTGTPHPRISAEAVQLYQERPAHYEIIGVVNVRTRGDGQNRVDRATRQLKHQAAIMGANGIILNPVEHKGLAGKKLNLSGQAIYVLP